MNSFRRCGLYGYVLRLDTLSQILNKTLDFATFVFHSNQHITRYVKTPEEKSVEFY